VLNVHQVLKHKFEAVNSRLF